MSEDEKENSFALLMNCLYTEVRLVCFWWWNDDLKKAPVDIEYIQSHSQSSTTGIF